jgi:transposase
VDTVYPVEEEVQIMSKYRALYAAAFRQQFVDLVYAGRRPEELAKEFGSSAPTISSRAIFSFFNSQDA